MNNQAIINRVETALAQWRSREERFSKLFSFSLNTNRALLKEKLNYYDRIVAKYKGTHDLEERFALKFLKQERNLIEKNLYPDLVTRLIRRLVVVPVREQIAIKQDNKRAEENSQSLHQQVQRAGFNGLSAKIEEQIKEDQQQFSIPVSYYLNDKERLDHQLLFIKDQSGLPRFEGYKTTLYDESKPGEKRQQYFSARNGYEVNATEAYNLLAGRCVQKSDTWVKLDLNDKDQKGNFRIKEFHPEYGYDLERDLRQLPLVELLIKEDTERLTKDLKSGNRVSVGFIKDGKEKRYYIEANPQFKSLNIYDEHSRKISLNTALGNKTADILKVVHKVNGQQHQTQSKKKGINTR